MHPVHILVFGGTDHVSARLIQRLVALNYQVSAVYEEDHSPRINGVLWIKMKHLAEIAPFCNDIQKVDVLINLSTLAVSKSAIEKSDTVRIAESLCTFACRMDIKRVIVRSSIAASVAESKEFAARRYGFEKLAADRVFLSRLNDRQLAVIRSPAIYGRDMRSSLSALVALIKRDIPLPLSNANAKRHYLSSDNFCDLIIKIIECSDKKWPLSTCIWLPSDGQSITTTHLIQMLGLTLKKKPRLFSFPISLLRRLGTLTGRSEMVSGAIDPLPMPGNKEIESAFGWTPSEQMPESLRFLKP